MSPLRDAATMFINRTLSLTLKGNNCIGFDLSSITLPQIKAEAHLPESPARLDADYIFGLQTLFHRFFAAQKCKIIYRRVCDENINRI